jgi:predicted amidohydrolase YtcJ
VQPLPAEQLLSLSLNWFVFDPPPQKDDLEREPLLRGRPVLLVRIDCHAYWVSNAILSKLYDIPDEVDGGLIVRDKAGKPTGPCRFLSLTGYHLAHYQDSLFLSEQECLSTTQRILSTN